MKLFVSLGAGRVFTRRQKGAIRSRLAMVARRLQKAAGILDQAEKEVERAATLADRKDPALGGQLGTISDEIRARAVSVDVVRDNLMRLRKEEGLFAARRAGKERRRT